MTCVLGVTVYGQCMGRGAAAARTRALQYSVLDRAIAPVEREQQLAHEVVLQRVVVPHLHRQAQRRRERVEARTAPQ